MYRRKVRLVGCYSQYLEKKKPNITSVKKYLIMSDTNPDKNEQEEEPVEFLRERDVFGFEKPSLKDEQSQIPSPTAEALNIPEKSNKKIYSKKIIQIFCIVFLPLFGGVLLMLNLIEIGNKKAAKKVLIFSVLYSTIIILIGTTKGFKISTLMYNLIGAVILSEYFFRTYFPTPDNFEKKEIWKPLIISILIVGTIFLVAYIKIN